MPGVLQKQKSIKNLQWYSIKVMALIELGSQNMSKPDLGPNPTQLSSTKAAVTMGHAPHPVVVGSHRGLLKGLHCCCVGTRKLDRIGSCD